MAGIVPYLQANKFLFYGCVEISVLLNRDSSSQSMSIFVAISQTPLPTGGCEGEPDDTHTCNGLHCWKGALSLGKLNLSLVGRKPASLCS